MIKKIMALVLMSSIVIPASAMNTEGANKLSALNDYVNKNIEYKREPAGIDNWQIPEKGGDCEDLALYKRKLLIEQGWDEADLKMLLLMNKADKGKKVISEGHVVLYSKSQNMVLDILPHVVNGKFTRMTRTKESTTNYDNYLELNKFTLLCELTDLSLGNKGAISKRCARPYYVMRSK
jgi:predicted transglutaminase-like cysteine proteinase